MADLADNLNTLLARTLARQPDATALITVDPDTGAEQHLSLRQLDDLVDRGRLYPLRKKQLLGRSHQLVKPYLGRLGPGAGCPLGRQCFGVGWSFNFHRRVHTVRQMPPV